MLELYRVPDSIVLMHFIETQGDGHELAHIYLGGFRFETYVRLSKLFPPILAMPFYDDVHLDSVEIEVMYVACQAWLAEGALLLLERLRGMLETAVFAGEGIITLCD